MGGLKAFKVGTVNSLTLRKPKKAKVKAAAIMR